MKLNAIQGLDKRRRHIAGGEPGILEPQRVQKQVEIHAAVVTKLLGACLRPGSLRIEGGGCKPVKVGSPALMWFMDTENLSFLRIADRAA